MKDSKNETFITNIQQTLVELIADFLDEVELNEMLAAYSDPVPRKDTLLHFRMAKAAMEEYKRTMDGTENPENLTAAELSRKYFSMKSTENALKDLGFKKATSSENEDYPALVLEAENFTLELDPWLDFRIFNKGNKVGIKVDCLQLADVLNWIDFINQA